MHKDGRVQQTQVGIFLFSLPILYTVCKSSVASINPGQTVKIDVNLVYTALGPENNALCEPIYIFYALKRSAETVVAIMNPCFTAYFVQPMLHFSLFS